MDETNLRYRTYPAARPRQRSLLNRDIIKLFEGLRVTDSFLMKNNVREILLPQAGVSRTRRTVAAYGAGDSTDGASRVVALLSDFGTRDHYVGTMKAVVLGVCPDATLVDITHEIPPHDVLAGALELAASYRYFPAGTVFLVVVDPGVGSSAPRHLPRKRATTASSRPTTAC